jgi:hypothetical protein
MLRCGVGPSLRAAAWARAGGALLLLVAVARPAPAQAAGPSHDTQATEERRTAIYRQGVEAATAGRWADAKERFAAALALRASPKVLFSLAQAEEQLGQLATASADYGRALEDAKAAHEAEVVSAAGQALAMIAPRVPKLRVVVTGTNAATATLDGRPLAVDAAVGVDPGAHRLVVSAPGMRESSATVAIGERQQLEVPVRLEAADGERAAAASPPSAAPPLPAGATTSSLSLPPASSAETGPAPAGGASPWRTIGLVTAGAGVVALGLSGYFALQAKSKNDQSNSSGCVQDNCTAGAAATRQDALSAASASTVSFVVGAVLAAGGITLWLLAPSAGSAPNVGVTPVALGPAPGVAIHGNWH